MQRIKISMSEVGAKEQCAKWMQEGDMRSGSRGATCGVETGGQCAKYTDAWSDKQQGGRGSQLADPFLPERRQCSLSPWW